MTDLVIAGFATSPILRNTDQSITTLAVTAINAAIADAGLTRADIDGYVGAPYATNAGSPHAEGGDEISLKTVSRAAGLRLVHGADLYRRYPTDMVPFAAHTLASGTCRYVLGLRAMYNLPGRSYATATTEAAYGDDQFTKPFGYTTAGARFATRARRYMAQNGASRDDLFAVVALARRHAALNPDAVWHGRHVDRDSYMSAAMIADPHGLFDCDMPVSGAAAFVMCRAADAPAHAQTARVTGWGGFADQACVYTMSGRTPADIATAQIYDGFSSMIWDGLENLGLAALGTAHLLIREGHADFGARLPTNTFGGSLGEGRMHGMGHLREAYAQATGRAGPRQQRTGPALVQVGPFDDSSALILEPTS